MAYDFKAMQTDLFYLTGQDDSVAVGSTLSKYLLNKAYVQTYMECLDDETVRQYVSSVPSVTLNIIPGQKLFNLPADFERVYKMSIIDFATDSMIRETNLFTDFKIVFDQATQKYQVLIAYNTPSQLYLLYCPKITTDLSGDTDTANRFIPPFLQEAISKFALSWYYEYLRDYGNQAAALERAQDFLNNRLNNYRSIQ